MSLVLRCANASTKLEIRANFIRTGNSVTGTWEERTFNLTGSLSGGVDGNSLNATISGSGFSATVSARTTGGNFTVTLTPDGTSGFKRFNATLRRG